MIASLIFAAAVASTTPPPAPADTSDDNKLICKSESVVGTRLPIRRCKTKAQIERQAQEAKELTRAIQFPGSTNSQ